MNIITRYKIRYSCNYLTQSILKIFMREMNFYQACKMCFSTVSQMSNLVFKKKKKLFIYKIWDVLTNLNKGIVEFKVLRNIQFFSKAQLLIFRNGISLKFRTYFRIFFRNSRFFYKFSVFFSQIYQETDFWNYGFVMSVNLYVHEVPKTSNSCNFMNFCFFFNI